MMADIEADLKAVEAAFERVSEDLIKAFGPPALVAVSSAAFLIKGIVNAAHDLPSDAARYANDIKEYGFFSGEAFASGLKTFGDGTVLVGAAAASILAVAGLVSAGGEFVVATEIEEIDAAGATLQRYLRAARTPLGVSALGDAISLSSSVIRAVTDGLNALSDYLEQAPIVNAPSAETAIVGQTISIPGVSISDPSAVGSAEILRLTVTAGSGTVAMTDASDAPLPGSDSPSITLYGTLDEINSDLSTLMYKGSGTAENALVLVDVSNFAGQEDNKSIGISVLATPTSPPSPIAPVLPPLPLPIGDSWGDAHLTTFDGLLYDFQAAGEFVFAESTVAGDSYQIQARLQPLGASTTVSVMTQVAAAVGSDRVTFDLTRADTVWVDGTPSTLSATNPTIALNGGTLKELSSNQYLVTWNTGETLTVTNYGPYFGISTQLAPTDGPGSIKGLLGSDTGQANDFQLADGTVLKQSLTVGELYGKFADAWRVTQATSLLDYGTGQTTATFTNLNFPSQPGSLADFTAAQVAAAAQLVAADGITDPNVAAAAELDYLETGDSSYITGAVAASQSNPNTTLAVITPTPNPVVTAPATETVTAAQTTPITGVSISDPSAIGAADSLKLSLSASSGAISMDNGSGGAALAGSGTGTIDVSGSLEQLNADLATLSYTAGTPGSASVALNVTDQAGVSAKGSIVVTVNAATPVIGFDGDQITLAAYYPNMTSADIIGGGTATVVPGTTTFPSLAALENGSNGTHLSDGSLTLNGDTMTFLYAPSEEGTTFTSAAANTYDIKTAASDPAITAASLISTNIPGLTAADLSFSAHTVDLNVEGLTLPTGVQGSIVLGFDFAGQSASAAASLIAHPST